MSHLIIIGGGNSIRSYPTLWDDIIGQDVMSVNYAYRYVKETPKYQISLDRKFWKNNEAEMDTLEQKGCKLINRHNEYITSKTYYSDGNYYCGARRLSGVFALSYATRKLSYDTIYLLGYDFGVIDGRTHFYDDVRHSGIGKNRAYLDEDGKVLGAVHDFNVFKDYDIRLVGKSNITAFDRLTYSQFKDAINDTGSS